MNAFSVRSVLVRGPGKQHVVGRAVLSSAFSVRSVLVRGPGKQHGVGRAVLSSAKTFLVLTVTVQNYLGLYNDA